MSDAEAEPDLASLRKELDVVDRRLLEMVRQRQQLVGAIQRVKAASGHTLFDREREREVFALAERRAAVLEVDPKLARALMVSLVEASHRQQEAHSVSIAESNGEAHRSIVIVGGEGQMGRLFATALAARGHHVRSLDRDDDLDGSRLVEDSDIVMLAVPMNLAVDMADRLAPRVREDALLCDINSLKRDVCEAMSASAGEVLGTHPMFGPTVESLRRQKVVICPVRPGPLSTWFTRELGRIGFDLIESTPIRHDQMMAIVQVLVHFRTLVMGEALRRTGVSIEESLTYTSPIYRLELAVVGRLFAQDPQLYAEIEMANPYGQQVRDHFLAAAAAVNDMVREGQRSAFETRFREVSDYFSDFSAEAMSLSDFLIEALVSRP